MMHNLFGNRRGPTQGSKDSVSHQCVTTYSKKGHIYIYIYIAHVIVSFQCLQSFIRVSVTKPLK